MTLRLLTASALLALAAPAFAAGPVGNIAAGQEKYQTFCIACHGTDGKGNPMLGAPDLTDDYWLYGGSDQTIQTTIRDGRQGVMPAQKDLLSAERIHVLAAYVYSLSHEQP